MLKKYHLNAEISSLLKLAIPLVISGFVYASMTFCSTIFLSHLGKESLVAGALVIWLFATLMHVLWGTLSSVSILVSHKHGANDEQAIALILRDGIILALIFVIPAVLILWNIGPVLKYFGQDQTTVSLSTHYLRSLAWGMPADFVGLVLVQFLTGLGYSRIGLKFILLLVILNITIGYLLSFGKLGLPALGISGIGWGTTISFWITFLSMFFFFTLHSKFKSYLNKAFHLSSLVFIRELFNVGMPMGIMFSIEAAYFFTLTLLMGHLDNSKLAANQIALQYLGQLTVIIISLSQAVTVRMGYSFGAKDALAAIRNYYLGLLFAIMCMVVVAICYWIFPIQLIKLDFNVTNKNNFEIIQYAIQFLKICAVFQILEAIRLTLFGALRSLKDTQFTLYTSILSYWAIAIPLGYILAIPLQMGGIGLWWGLLIGTSTSIILLYFRLNKKLQNSLNNEQMILTTI